MRGKTATPFTRIGAESSTVGVPGGRGLEVGGDVGCVGVTPGGSEGGRTNGDPPPSEPVPPAPTWAEAGTAVAAVEPGQGSVRNEPRASAVMPFRQRATTRNLYDVFGSRPARVVRDVSSPRAAVVGDQIPKRSSTPTSRTTRAASGTRHFTTAENGCVSTETTSGAGVLVAFAPLDASAPNALSASRERAAQRRSMGGTSAGGRGARVPRTRDAPSARDTPRGLTPQSSFAAVSVGAGCVSTTARRASIS